MLKTITIVTTAAYPWLTGTAIIALLKAFFLARRGIATTLCLPWIPPRDQYHLFGEKICFTSPQAQERAIREYLPEPDCPSLTMEFYPGRYIKSFGSILPSCTLSRRIRPCDWLILEEPEHLNWFQPWNRFKKCAPRVTGIVLTNYYYYWCSAMPGLPFLPRLMEAYNRLLVRHHCDDIQILSRQMDYYKGATLTYSCGVHPSFFQVPPPEQPSGKVYFIGKLLWDKGFREMADLLEGSMVSSVDVFGGGPDQNAIAGYAQTKGISFCFKGITSHPARDLKNYAIFLNMSRSEICCTTTADALAMGKFVILPKIPSNERYIHYKNCLAYGSPREFCQQLAFALKNVPQKDPAIQELSWEAAVDRLLDYYHRIKPA